MRPGLRSDARAMSYTTEIPAKVKMMSSTSTRDRRRSASSPPPALLAEVLRRSAHHQAGDEDGGEREDEHPVQAGADATRGSPPSIMWTSGTAPPIGVKLSCAELTEPVEVSVVNAANSPSGGCPEAHLLALHVAADGAERLDLGVARRPRSTWRSRPPRSRSRTWPRTPPSPGAGRRRGARTRMSGRRGSGAVRRSRPDR